MGLIAAAGAFRKYLEALLLASTPYGGGRSKPKGFANGAKQVRREAWLAKRRENPVFKLTAWQRRFWQQQGGSLNPGYIERVSKLKYRKDGDYLRVLKAKIEGGK